jgi:hypothetical protein
MPRTTFQKRTIQVEVIELSDSEDDPDDDKDAHASIEPFGLHSQSSNTIKKDTTNSNLAGAAPFPPSNLGHHNASDDVPTTPTFISLSLAVFCLDV